MGYVQRCPGFIDQFGQCSEPLEWVEFAVVTPLTYSEFMSIFPYLVGALFTAWGIRQLLRLIFNNK